MAIYQPSFCVPRNQAIDATNQDDMTFSFKLNGNNPLVAYNIQIYDNDTNELVYELISTENERAIEAKIKEIRSWLGVQETKQIKVNEAKEEYKASTIKTKFRDTLKKTIANDKKKLADMEETLQNKKAGKTLTQTQITEYFQYWGDFVRDLGNYIGDEENPQSNTGEYILQTIESWLNIDPYRKDGIEYKDKNVKVIDRTAFDKVKSLYRDFKSYYEGVMEARKGLGASDLTYIKDDTLNKARQTLYLIYSEFSNESYFGKDLYESINSVWIRVDFEKLENEVNKVYGEWEKEVSQQEYALAHLSGGYTKQETSVYNSPTVSNSNVKQILKKGTSVAIITATPEAPAGWYAISSNGSIGYVQSQDIALYNIKTGKYYLEEPVYPTNYEGEQNTVHHQLPLKVTDKNGNIVDTLKNGKGYKWSVTLYWSTSGKYNEEDKIDGSLTSVENYFDTRKRPEIGIYNFAQIFSIPYNYTTLNKDTLMYIEQEDRSITIKSGSNVRIINLVDEENANIEYIDEGTNKSYIGVIDVANLTNLGYYEDESNPTMPLVPSKKANFIGYYEQEQYTSIAYFRWILYKLQYSTEEIVEVVKDTGMVPSADFQFFYDGFLNDEKYALKIFVQTLDNVEVETGLIKFKASYITFPIENMLNAENSPIEHGIIVEWSNLRLIQGEVINNENGGYIQNIPVQDKTSYQLQGEKRDENGEIIQERGELIFDKDKGKPLSIDFDTNQILCTRFDEDRPVDRQVYYTASGLDDNGEVISKTLELVPDEDTQSTGIATLVYTVKTAKEETSYEQKIYASPLYWYVIIMTSTGFTIYNKYAQGLFPAIDQYPNLNKFTGQYGLYPDALTYLEEPSKRVEYNYQTIVDRDGNEIKN